MIKQEFLTLWNKIQHFTFDDGTAVTTFSRKLAAKQNWSPEFTQKAIEEYKKFMLLCCVSAKGAAPSQIVDEVWHLHLTYTQSYWIDFCRNTLGKDIHHHPSTGGAHEDQRHFLWYKETWQLYRDIFGTDPPEDIWPAPRRIVAVPGDPPFKWTTKRITVSLLFLSIPFVFTTGAFGNFFPFFFTGPQFILFYFLYAGALLAIYHFYIDQRKEQLEDITAAHFPDDVSPFEMAHFLYGKHRALQTAIIDLIKRGLLVTSGERSFQVKKDKYTPLAEEKNPLVFAYEKQENDSVHTYKDIGDDWYKQIGADWGYEHSKFTHPALAALDKFAYRKEPFLILLLIAIYIVPAARIIQGISNHRPVFFLIVEVFVVTFVFLNIRSSVHARHLIVYKKAGQLFREQYESLPGYNDQIVPRYALEGLSAVSGFAEIAFLSAVFTAYSPTAYRGGLNDQGTSSGSSCGGSSCGGGSCGGGCGGCGGGGD